MWVLHLGLAFHLRFLKLPMDYFIMNLHANITFGPWSSFKGTPKLCIGYFKVTLHVRIAFKVGFSPKVTKITYRFRNELEFGYYI
jgi:hypothetical protein